MNNLTPETDAQLKTNAIKGECVVAYQFARQLERQRDEAKQMYSRLRESVNGMAPADLEQLAWFEANYFNVEKDRDQLLTICEEFAKEQEYGPVAGCELKALTSYQTYLKERNQTK